MIVEFEELYGSITITGHPLFGRRHFGVPIGGPFDFVSHSLANSLLGNHPDCPTLELSAAVGKLKALEGGVIAWVGAGAFQGVRRLESGESLQIPYPKSGCRSYLAMVGGVLCGAEEGRHGFRSLSSEPGPTSTLASPPTYESDPTLAVVKDPDIADEIWAPFISGNYSVDTHSSRTGIRLISDVPHSHRIDLPSEPTDIGLIQLPPSGHPLILGPDGPTIGGYLRLGHVPHGDQPKLAQLRPGASIRFQELSPVEAAELTRSVRERLRRHCQVLELNSSRFTDGAETQSPSR